MVVQMKKIVTMLLMLSMVFALTANVSAVERVDPETGVNLSLRADELQAERKLAEELLMGECKLDSQEIKRVGNYVVETRLYVLEDEKAASRSGGCGGVSSHTWRAWGSSEWDTKVLFAAFFYHNGTTAICRPEESKFWVIAPDNTPINRNFNPEESYRDGSTATARCKYARDEPGTSSDLEIFGTLKVACTKDGVVEIESEKEHRY